jgi:hypothetical protein
LEQAGFDVIDEQQPSFLFERSVLVTGEVPRTTGYEPASHHSKRGCTTMEGLVKAL